MKTQFISPVELRRLGTEILVKELGYANAMRFLHQFEAGLPGVDYTRDRQDILPKLTTEEVLELSRQYLKKPPAKKKNARPKRSA